MNEILANPPHHNDPSKLAEAWTDHYFLKTKKVVEKKGDKTVTYAVFMRRPVLFAPKIMVGNAPPIHCGAEMWRILRRQFLVMVLDKSSATVGSWMFAIWVLGE